MKRVLYSCILLLLLVAIPTNGYKLIDATETTVNEMEGHYMPRASGNDYTGVDVQDGSIGVADNRFYATAHGVSHSYAIQNYVNDVTLYDYKTGITVPAYSMVFCLDVALPFGKTTDLKSSIDSSELGLYGDQMRDVEKKLCMVCRMPKCTIRM